MKMGWRVSNGVKKNLLSRFNFGVCFLAKVSDFAHEWPQNLVFTGSDEDNCNFQIY
jgi:hypothetical protein